LLAVAAACLAQNLWQVNFIIAGAGAEADKLKELARQQNLANITWAGTLNREQVKAQLAAAHATYTSFDTQPVLRTTSPNKFFDSLAAGKLTIVNTQGWLKDLVEQHNCGFYAAPDSPEDFIRQLLPYLQQPQLLQQAQQNARKLAESNFSRERITQQFLQLFPLPA
jgi:glycosyltransferase involved in cell wall biosynthesis